MFWTLFMLIKIFANEFVYRVRGHWANLLLKRGVIFLTKSYSGILFHAHRTTLFFILLNAHKSSENLSRKHAFSRDHLLDRWDEVHYWHNDANSVVVSQFYWPWSCFMIWWYDYIKVCWFKWTSPFTISMELHIQLSISDVSVEWIVLN